MPRRLKPRLRRSSTPARASEVHAAPLSSCLPQHSTTPLANCLTCPTMMHVLGCCALHRWTQTPDLPICALMWLLPNRWWSNSPSILVAMRTAVLTGKALRVSKLEMKEAGAYQGDCEQDILDFRHAFHLATLGGAQVYLF